MSGWGDLIEDLLDQEIKKNAVERYNRRRIKEKFSASNAGYCPRAAVLNRLGVDEVDKDERTKRVLWVGTVLHDAVFKLLKDTGKLLPQSEKFLNPTGSFIWGAPDFVIKGNNAEVILDELKSIATGSFWAKIVKSKKPHKHHVYQAVTYYLLLTSIGVKIDKVKISYLSKQDSAIRSFWVELTPELLKEVQEWWDSVNAYYEKNELPPVFPEGSEDREDKCVGPKGEIKCTFAPLYCIPNPTLQIISTQEVIDKRVKEIIWPKAEKS